MSNKAFLSVKNASFGYGKKIILDGVDISLERGRILSLIGPNGAGKSTLLKGITTQLRAISGTVFLDGQDIYSYRGDELAKKMSVVTTETVAPELYTCYDVVSFGRYPYTGRLGILSDDDKRAVSEAMELTGISDIGGEYFSSLSDGLKQRAMLARAICQNPSVMILDEPTAYLDIKYKLEALSILKYLAKEKNTAICMSLHEIELAAKVSDFILCVKDGHIDKYGPPSEVITTGYINRLYDIKKGSYDVTTGHIELE